MLCLGFRFAYAEASPISISLIEEAGVEYDSTIRSPNAALAVRGTLVSLYDQPPFAPEAVSLTGRAVFRNTRRQLVAFGGMRRYLRGDRVLRWDKPAR